MSTTTKSESGSTRTRLLEATRVVLAQFGPRKLSLTDIAALAGVSRPTLYRHFGSRQELLVALADYEKDRFQAEMATALDGLTGSRRLDRAMCFIADFQRDYSMQGLVAVEPAFMLEQLEQAVGSMTPPLVSLFHELPPGTANESMEPEDLADLVIRIALSHFLIKGSDAQLLRELRHVVLRSG